MKNIIFLLLFTLLLAGCERKCDPEECKTYTIKLYMVGGYIRTVDVILPEETYFYITHDHILYSNSPCVMEVRWYHRDIIDYEILKKE